MNREMSASNVKLEPAKPIEENIKEISMEVSRSMEGGASGGKTRRRRRGSRRQKGGAAEEADGTMYDAVVQKEGAQPVVAPTFKPATATAIAAPPAQAQAQVPMNKQTGGVVAAPKKAATVAVAPVVVIAPPKKKAPKVTLVPKAATAAGNKRIPVKKTFKARRVRLLIKNRKTIKRQQEALQKVDTLTDEKVREAAVTAGLTRQDANAPVELLRTMLKDYQTMRGGFL